MTWSGSSARLRVGLAPTGQGNKTAAMADLDVPFYLARPAAPAGAGIVVIHEGNGMTLQLLRFCERLAAEGYLVAAPDLFFRTGGPEAKADYMEQVQEVRPDQMLDDLGVAAAALRDLGAGSMAVMGFCMGGAFTWRAARQADGYDAAVGFYGVGIASDLGQTRCPTLLFFGGSDQYISPEDVRRVADYHPATVVYPEAGHGFMRDGSEDYVPDAAADAWARTLAHFGEHLGGAAGV
jgi:carboxymethylenebutenolidase